LAWFAFCEPDPNGLDLIEGRKGQGGHSMRKATYRFSVGTAVVVGLLTAASAQNQPAGGYNPGIADLMNLIVQPRHTKLWFAGNEGNWRLAEYENKELKGALANVAKARPRFRDKPVAELIEAFMSASFRSVEDAIKAEDATKFAEAYASVNTGCNSCHKALDQDFVVIQTPEQHAYPDQNFRRPR
jgi:hypothetical protein